MSSEGLSIRDVTRRTGVEASTLRIWEQRHGFPVPERLPSGHRRYSHTDVELIRQVRQDRDNGVALKAAIDHAKRAVQGKRPLIEDDSIFSGMRKRRPDLQPYLLRKSTLVAVSHAIEDECSVGSNGALLFASFQREAYYRHAEPRWRDLTQAARGAFVLADFDEVRQPEGGPVEVPIDTSEPLGREWSLIYDAHDFGAVLSGWERPGQSAKPDLEREFEAMWSVEPDLVRDASTVAYGIVERTAPEVVGGIEHLLAEPVEPQHPSVAKLTRLTNRMIAYVGAGPPPSAEG
ncbi:MAG: DICT sensory domain-containing protein [Thermoleophilaceae bacterium]